MQACAQIHLHLQVSMQMLYLHLHLHLIALWWMQLHLHLHLLHPHLHLHLHLIQMHLIGIKCETNANQMRLYYCYITFIFLVGFAWNKPLIAVSGSHSAHKHMSKPMWERLSCLDCQGDNCSCGCLGLAFVLGFIESIGLSKLITMYSLGYYE